MRLFRFPKEWKKTTVGNEIEFAYGKNLPKTVRIEGDFPVYGSNGIVGTHYEFLVDFPSIVIGRKGTVGSVHKTSANFWPTDVSFYVKINDSKKLQLDFVYFLLLHLNLPKYSQSGPKSGLNRNDVYKIEFSLPPLQTQKKIVQKLDDILGQLEEKKKEISELINKNKKNIQTLTEQLQGEYISKIFESKQVLQNSNIKRLDEICIINPSKQEINDMDDKTQVSFIPMKLVDDKEGIITSTEIRNLGDVKKGYTYFKENDVIFAKITPCMENGKCAIGIGLENGIAFGSTEFHVFRVNDDVLPEWIYYFLRQYKLKREAEKNMTGTAGQKRVPKEFLASCKIPVPSKKIQREMIKKFVESSDKIFSNTKSLNSILDNHENLLKQLDNSQSSILDAAFSGKLIQ